MEYRKLGFIIIARGHPAILATHPTTLEVTTEDHLTTKGDCIVAVSASCGPANLPPGVKSLLSNDFGIGVLSLSVGRQTFTVHGKGSHGLTFTHGGEIVVRRSGFVSDRTLMVHSNKAAIDIPRRMVRSLQNPDEEVRVEISAYLQAPPYHPLLSATSSEPLLSPF